MARMGSDAIWSRPQLHSSASPTRRPYNATKGLYSNGRARTRLEVSPMTHEVLTNLKLPLVNRDSGWELRIRREGEVLIFAIHWEGRTKPAAVATRAVETIKELLQ